MSGACTALEHYNSTTKKKKQNEGEGKAKRAEKDGRILGESGTPASLLCAAFPQSDIPSRSLRMVKEAHTILKKAIEERKRESQRVKEIR